MNKDIIQGNWTQFKARGLRFWGRITGDEWDVLNAKREELLGRLQERYGWAREEAESRLHEPTDQPPPNLRH